MKTLNTFTLEFLIWIIPIYNGTLVNKIHLCVYTLSIHLLLSWFVNKETKGHSTMVSHKVGTELNLKKFS